MKSKNSIFICLIFAIAVSMTGCGNQMEYPSINYTASKSHDFGQIVWRDLFTPDPKKAAEFYKNVFGWTSVKYGTGDEEYWMFKSNGKPVAGMYFMKDAKKNAGGEWLQYYSVPSLEDAVKKSKSAGGSVIIKPTDIPGRGMVALMTDPQNAYFAFIKSANGDPEESGYTDNAFMWNELWSNDMEKSSDFYQKVLNSQVESRTDDSRAYTVLKNNGKPSSGIIKNPVENVRTNWVQYIKVTDVKLIEDKVKNAGGHTLIPSDTAIRKGTVAVFTDPTGAPFAIQKWPIE